MFWRKKKTAAAVTAEARWVKPEPRWGGVFRIIENTRADGQKELAAQIFVAGVWEYEGQYLFVPEQLDRSNLEALSAYLDEKWQREIVSTRVVVA